jgi:hypothetical protein
MTTTRQRRSLRKKFFKNKRNWGDEKKFNQPLAIVEIKLSAYWRALSEGKQKNIFYKLVAKD